MYKKIRISTLDISKFNAKEFEKYVVESFKGLFNLQGFDYSKLVIKSDCEGIEWQVLTPELLSRAHDWVVACHTPVLNQDLLTYLSERGRTVGRQGKIEFAIYKKA